MLYDNSFLTDTVKTALKNQAEYNFMDFKFKLSDNNNRIKEHINAFGNLDRGGCFVFGVKNYIPNELECDWDTIIQKITHIAMNTQEPPLTVKTIPIEIGDKKLLCLYILPSRTKPVFIKDRMQQF